MNTDSIRAVLETLKKEEAVLRDRLEPLTAEWRQKQEQIAAVERALVLLESEPSDGRHNVALPEGNSKRPADVAYRVLADAKQPLQYLRLLSLMETTGFTMKGTNPGANLLAHIGRDERIIRVGKGMYALREWNLRETAKKRRGKKPSSRRTK